MYESIKKRLKLELEDIEKSGRYKNERIIQSKQNSIIKVNNDKNVLNFCANNYLGLASNPIVINKAKETLESHGFGMASVRFICGTQDIHKTLEKKISNFLGTEDTILYAAAFDANGGLFEPLFNDQDAIISDALNHASKFLEENHIVFQPGVNEDLAATAIHGTQQTTLVEKPKYDGVFGVWYGKGPGVDRSGDAIKHGNYAGTSKYGGVLALAGDDHGAKSSTTAHQSDHAFIHFGMPILNPSTVQDYLDFGILGWAMSRYSGCWVGFKCVTDTVESAASVDISLDRFKPAIPDNGSFEDENIHIKWGFTPAASESRLYNVRLPAAQAFARVNSIDKVIFKDKKKLAIVTSGKAYLDVRQALDELGLNENICKKIGISLYKVGMVWPLEDQKILNFVEGHKEVLVIEEKRPIVEDQLTKYLYNKKIRPQLVGKKDEKGNLLVPSEGELSPSMVALIIGKRIEKLSLRIKSSNNKC